LEKDVEFALNVRVANHASKTNGPSSPESFGPSGYSHDRRFRYRSKIALKRAGANTKVV
jgi:hypothetical protein